MWFTTRVKSKMDRQGRRRRVRRTGCRLTTHDHDCAITKEDNAWLHEACPNADGERPLEEGEERSIQG